MRSSLLLLTLAILVMALFVQEVFAVGMGGYGSYDSYYPYNPYGQTGQCVARNSAEAYCANHGGCPRNGYCYFPDGTYCEVWSFYNGKCPSKEYYEQALWEAEAYRFLYSDYYPAYTPGYWPYGDYYYYNYPTGYGAYGQDWMYPSTWQPYMN